MTAPSHPTAALSADQLGLLPVHTAAALLARLAPEPKGAQSVGLAHAVDRVVAQEVIAPFSVPPHDNAAMDGYAFAGSALERGGQIDLKVIGSARAGKPWQGRVENGQCVKITTGAVLPNGCDTVVPQEWCANTPGGIGFPLAKLHAGEHCRRAGEDIAAGQRVLDRGDVLSAAAIGLLASINQAEVSVFWRPRVAYLSTGDELLALGDAHRNGRIYDSNRHTLRALIHKWGCEWQDLGSADDDANAIETILQEASKCADLVLTSGGVSVGDTDHTKAAMAKLAGAQPWRLAMRPGQHLSVGRLGECLLVGLPGNPVASVVSMLAVVQPALAKMKGIRAGHPGVTPLTLCAQCTEPIKKKPGRTEYQRGIATSSTGGGLTVKTAGRHQGSAMLSGLAQANCFIVLRQDQGDIAAGDTVDVMLFQGMM